MPHALVNVLQQGLREYSGRQGALMATLCSWEGAQRVCGSSWYVPCVFIRLPVYPDFLQTLQLTLRPFDEGFREPEGAGSFLCEEFEVFSALFTGVLNTIACVCRRGVSGGFPAGLWLAFVSSVRDSLDDGSVSPFFTGG